MPSGEEIQVKLTLLDNLSTGLESAVGKVNSAMSAMRSAATSGVSNIGGTFSGLGGFVQSAGGILNTFGKGFGNVVSGAFNIAKSTIGKIGSFFFDMSSQAKWASAFATAEMVKWGESLVGLASKFERLSYSADYLLKGTTQTSADFAKAIRSIAKDTMFDVDQMSDSMIKLVGNTKDVGKSETWLRNLADAVAATGGSYSELEGATRAMIQVNSKAKLSSEELNRQFANANIPVIRALAESMEKDATNPLWKYIGAASSGTGANKTLTTSFKNASDQIGILSKNVDVQKKSLDQLVKASGQQIGTESFDRWAKDNEKAALAIEKHQLSLMRAEASYNKANGTINTYNSAMSKSTTSTKAAKMSVDQIMSALQDVGDLNIPGTIGAEAISKALQEAYGGANLNLLNTFDGQMSLIGDTLKLTALSFMGLDESFKPVKGGLFDLLKSGLTPVLTFLNDHQQDLINFADNITKNIPVMTAFGGAIIGIAVPALLMLIAPLLLMGAKFAFLGFVLGLIVEKLGGWGAVFNMVKGAWDSVFPVVISGFDTLKTTVTAVGNFLSTTFGPTWTLLRVAFQATADVFSATLGPALKQLFDTFVKFWPVIAAIAGSIFTHLLAVINGIVTAIAAALPFIVTIVSSVVNYITGIIQFVLGFIQAIMQILVGVCTFNLKMIGEGFVSILTAIWDLVRNTFTSIWQFLVGIFGTVLSLVSGFIAGFIAFFVGLFDALIGHSIIPDLVNGIIDWISNLVKTVLEAINSFVKSIIQFFVDMAKGAILGVVNMVNTLVEKFTSLKDGIKGIVGDIARHLGDTFGGLASSALNWGRNIIGNMIQGIKNAIAGAGKLASKLLGELGISGDELKQYAHGGIVPGPLGSPIPILAHGGERVIPSTGVDVSNGGGSTSLNINFTGPVTMDSEDRINELAQKIIRMMGRQNELARYGLG